jgi:hypothetical protein
VKSKIALVKNRIALEKRVQASRGQVGRQPPKVAGPHDGVNVLLETEDHLKFQSMLGKVCEVDEEVTALRRSVLGSEQQARLLRVQKKKLDRSATPPALPSSPPLPLVPASCARLSDPRVSLPLGEPPGVTPVAIARRLGAVLRSKRLVKELTEPTGAMQAVSTEAKTLLWATARLHSLIDAQGEQDPGQLVPHLSEYDAAGTQPLRARAKGVW